MIHQQSWYIIQQNDDTCQIISVNNQPIPETGKYWGPFVSREEAITRRVGLIRTGKCKPL